MYTGLPGSALDRYADEIFWNCDANFSIKCNVCDQFGGVWKETFIEYVINKWWLEDKMND